MRAPPRGYPRASHVNGYACRQQLVAPKAIMHQGMWAVDCRPNFVRRTGYRPARAACYCSAGYGTATKEDTTRLSPLTNA